MLPYLSDVNKSKATMLQFKGYNHNKAISEGEMYDMKNLSSDEYPLLVTRNKRQEVQTLTKPNGIFAKTYLAYVDGTEFYYNSLFKGYVSDSKKKFYSIGAYIIIMPDKKYFNTANDDFGNIEAEYTGSAVISNSKIIAQGIGTYFKQFDAIEISGCATDSNNKSAVIQKVEDNAISFTSYALADESNITSISVKRSMPDMDFMTEHENRLWGCSSKNHEIYACKLGDPTNWKCFEGIASDSYAVTIGSDGDFTGACTHMGYVIFFKENHIHKVMGSKPMNYQAMDTQALGVAKGSEKSLVNINGVLYYNSIEGIAAYQGGLPEIVSSKLGIDPYFDAVAGHYKNKYYVSMKNYINEWSLFVLDTKTGLWFKEDDLHVEYFSELDGALYYIDGTELMKIDGISEEIVEWYAEFGDFEDGTFGRKSISKIILRYSLESGNHMDIYIQYDSDGTWNKVCVINSDSDIIKKAEAQIIPHRCDHFRIKIEGTGDVTLYEIQKNIAIGSDK